MQIAVNARFLTQPITGVQRYALEISRRIKKLHPETRFFAPQNIIHREVAAELEAESFGHLRGHIWEQLELPRQLRRNDNPLLLCLATAAPLYYSRKIVTIHDLSFRHFPHAVSWRFRKLYEAMIPRILSSSLHITTVSDFSKRDICSAYGILPEHISVIANASSFPICAENTHSTTQRTIVAVGSLQPYKNLEFLINAFAIFNRDQRTPYKLKIVGSADKRVFRKIPTHGDTGDTKNVELTGRIDDQSLLNLYMSAQCFVFPSLFEGFGIPPLEAMACNCPVLASTAASIPEVCGDAALYFDPKDTHDLVQKLREITTNAELRADLVQRGRKNVGRFSWEQTTTQILNLTKSLT